MGSTGQSPAFHPWRFTKAGFAGRHRQAMQDYGDSLPPSPPDPANLPCPVLQPKGHDEPIEQGWLHTLPSRLGKGLEAKHPVALVFQCSSNQPSTSANTDRVSRLTRQLTQSLTAHIELMARIEHTSLMSWTMTRAYFWTAGVSL